MSTFTIVMIVILVILIGVLVGLYIFRKEGREKTGGTAGADGSGGTSCQHAHQSIKMKLRLKEAGLPQMVVDNTPKYLRRTKFRS